MSVKLFRYDAARIFRQIIPVYIAALLLSAIVWVLLQQQAVLIRGIGKAALYLDFLMLAACLIAPILFVWMDFYKTMYLDPSYLSHTLPLKTTCLYNKKCLEALAASLTSAAVVILGSMMLSADFLEYAQLIEDTIGIGYMTIQIVLQVFLFMLSGFAGMITAHKLHGRYILLSIVFGVLFDLAANLICVGIFIAMLAGAGYFPLQDNVLPLEAASVLKPAVLIGYGTACLLVYLAGLGLVKTGVEAE